MRSTQEIDNISVMVSTGKVACTGIQQKIKIKVCYVREITSVNNEEAQDLDSVVRKSFLRTALIPILTAQLILLCLYFFSTNYITEKNLDLLRSNALETVLEMAKTEARSIDNQLTEIRRNSLFLQADHQAMFKREASSHITGEKLFSEKLPNDLSRDLNPSGFTSLYLSSYTPMSPSIQETIFKTQEMDSRFKSLVDNNANLVAAYFNSWNNLTRVYPTMTNFHNQLVTDFDMSKFNFYHLASEKRNPQRSPVWTDVYLDPAGKGWMLSSLVPIYQNNFLRGVTGLDVTLSTFSRHILSADLQWNSGALVVDHKGNILTLSRAAESYLGLTDTSDLNAKNNAVDRPLTKPTEFNFLKQNTMAGMYFSEFFNGIDESIEFTMQGDDYLVTKQAISETGWQLFVMAPLKNVYGPIITETEQIANIGFVFLGLAPIFYALFFVYLKRSSKQLANRITSPIAQVTNLIISYDSGDEVLEIHEPVNIIELDRLLSMNLKIQKAKLRYEKISKEMEIKNEQLKVLAITDQLTKLYNRLKLDEVLGYEIARSHRDESPLSIAIIDVDKFKLVNDTFGHQVGDSVLIGISQIMLRNIRSTDILGRWGGEEFLLILPNTPLEQAYEHSNKLRQLIEEAVFTPVKQTTISVGLASCTTYLDEKMLVELADNALYAAKENGRNRVELATNIVPQAQGKPVSKMFVS